MDKKIITKNSNETKILGSEFSKKLKAGDIILLFGQLGSGKTTFVQGVAEGLGVANRIVSPSFVLIRTHSVNQGDIKNLNHIDLYRVEKPQELTNLGLNELINEEGSVTFIEWADRLVDLKQDKIYKIYVKYLNGNEREITIGYYEFG